MMINGHSQFSSTPGHKDSGVPTHSSEADGLETLSRFIELLQQKAQLLEQEFTLARQALNVSRDLQDVFNMLESETTALENEIQTLLADKDTCQAGKAEFERKLAEVDAQNRDYLAKKAARTSSAKSGGGFDGGNSLFLSALDTNELYVIVQEEIINDVKHRGSILANLYSTLSCLFESLDHTEVVTIIKEVVVNLIGSEQVAVYEMDSDQTGMKLQASVGLDQATYGYLPVNQGLIGKVVSTGNPFIASYYPEEQNRLSREEGLTACVPLKVNGQVIGAVVIFKLLAQKACYSDMDREILEVLSTHAGQALHYTHTVARHEGCN